MFVRALRPVLSTVAVLALAACDAGSAALTTAPRAPSLSSIEDGPTLLSCPTSAVRQATATIGADGGKLGVGGHRLVVPAGAVDAPTEFTVTVPASTLLEIELRANGAEHATFAAPLTVTISYERCTNGQLEPSVLRAYYIDESDVVLADMGGTVDDKAGELTFTTDHFSDYAVGAP